MSDEHSLLEGVEEENPPGTSVVPLDLRPVDDFVTNTRWRNCPSPESPRKPVKSTAVVKYSTVQSLANFAVLQCNTDLNSPPSNWLRSSADSYGLQHVPAHSTGFSSFRMAHMFPECVGEVDVVSDAENIKKLLKIPYSKGPVSMMVHRIENTLLIDEFDIHKYLIRTAESEWEWLKKFFFEHVLQSLSEKEKGLFHKKKSRGVLQQKSLVSKFLYHSLAVGQGQEVAESSPETPQSSDSRVPVPVPAADPPLPEPNLEEELPDTASNHEFTRNVVWTFEDIQMFIGSNLPIFGGQTHPCISLKLRDMSKPINVLTGIDYWLDNLMCNVPELVMCYHLDGIVQKYELIKTEELPHLENSKFSPKVIRDVAQNILSFLKSNATKAGHTYWLFKGKDAEIVKLYDLTSLCTDMMDDKGQNPFTVPVAMLLYRVARNMKHSSDGQHQKGTIRMLLKNCISLLSKEKYPQIVTSAHYMLSDLYIPADTDPVAPNLSDRLDEESSSTSEFEEEDLGPEAEDRAAAEGEESPTSPSSSVDVKSLCVSTLPPAADSTPPPPLCADVGERCNSALQHVAAGLQCLTLFDCSEADTLAGDFGGNKKSEKEPDSPSMAKPFEAIPMPYTPLNKLASNANESATASPSNNSKKRKKDSSGSGARLAEESGPQQQQALSPRSLLCKYRAEAMPTWQQPKPSDKVFWCSHLRILLYEKACLVYATLAEREHGEGQYGAALRYIGLVLRCQQRLEALARAVPNCGLQSYLLGRAADLCFMLVQDWAHVQRHRQQLGAPTDVDRLVQQEVGRDWPAGCEPEAEQAVSGAGAGCVPHSISSMEQMLLASRACYVHALQLEPLEQQRSTLQRRLGNIENELGVLYMNQAAGCYQEKGLQAWSEDSSLQALLNKSLRHLESGMQAFDSVKDEANVALLHSNTGRLMRMCAHYHSPQTAARSEMAGLERNFYNKALSNYQRALQVLGNRKCNPEIWDTVFWELSTTLFSMATILQDFPSLGQRTQEEAEREVVEYFQKALKYCDLETPGSRQPVYQFRAATIHHRLASLYHRSYRFKSSEETRRKNMLQLTKLHYEKASRLLQILEHPSVFLRVQMERVALAEFQAQQTSSTPVRVKNLLIAVDLLVQCIPMLRVVQEGAGASCAPESHPPGDAAATDLGMGGLNLTEEAAAGDAAKPLPRVDEDAVEHEEIEALLQLLEQRLQFVLLQLTKLHHGRTGQAKKEADGCANLYKSLYSLTLRKSSKGNSLSQHLASVLSQIESALGQTSPKGR